MTGQAVDLNLPGARVRVKIFRVMVPAGLGGRFVMLSADSAAIALSDTPDSVRFATDLLSESS